MKRLHQLTWHWVCPAGVGGILGGPGDSRVELCDRGCGHCLYISHTGERAAELLAWPMVVTINPLVSELTQINLVLLGLLHRVLCSWSHSRSVAPTQGSCPALP